MTIFLIRKLNEIRRRFPSLSSQVATLERELLLVCAIIRQMPRFSIVMWDIIHYGTGREEDLYRKLDLAISSIKDIELYTLTPIAKMESRITECFLNLEVLKPWIKEIYVVHLKNVHDIYRGGDIDSFVWALEEVVEAQLDFKEEAVSCVQNLRAFLDLCLHLEQQCEGKENKLRDSVIEIRMRARAVADHTAIFLYSCWVEKDADLQLLGYNLNPTHLLQMTDLTQPAVSAFYLKIFNSFGLSANTLPGEIDSDADEMNFIDHLLLYLKNQIVRCHESQCGFLIDKLMAYETLVKASVPDSAMSLLNMSPNHMKILYEGIIKHATAVLSVSSSKGSKEKNMDERFDQFVDKLEKSGFVGHLLHCDNKSLNAQLGKFSEYMALKAIIPHPTLRYMLSKIVFQKIVVKLVKIVLSLSSIDAEEVDRDIEMEKILVLPAEFDVANLIDKYEKFREDVKEISDLQLDVKYKVIGEQEIGQYIDGLEDVQKQYLSSNKQAVISVKNLRSFQHFSNVIANWYKNEDLLNNLNSQLLLVVEHTAIFLCSCWIEPEKNQELKLIHILQMSDQTSPRASGFYFKIFNSLGLPYQVPFPETDKMNFIDHLLVYLKNQIIHCQESQAGFQFDKLIAYETLVKASVSDSPMPLQNMVTNSKIIMYGGIIKHATLVLSFSFSKDSKEKNMDESFCEFVDKLVKSGFVGHLLHCDKKSLNGQLEKFSEYMTLLKAVVTYPPLRYMLSKLILPRVIVNIVKIVSSFSSIDTEEVEDDIEMEKTLVFPAEFDKYGKFMEDVKEIHDLQRGMKYKVTGEEAIGQYINGLEEVQKQYLSSNKKAIIAVQNLRSFQHLSKVIVNWYTDKDLLNNINSQLLLVVEHTAIFLCSCWLEPEKNQELKMAQLLQMTNIKNAKVHSIYVHRFKTLEQSVYSPWPNEIVEASFIDHILFYLNELTKCQSRSLVALLMERLEKFHRFLTVLKNTVPVKGIVPSSRHQYTIPSKMRAFHSVVIKFVRTMATISTTDSEETEKENLELLHDLEKQFTLMKTELRKSTIIDYPSIGFEFSCFFENLEETLTFRTDEISPMKHQFDMVYTGLLKLKSFLDKIKDKEEEKDLRLRIAQVSCNAEVHIQSYVNKDGPTFYHAMQLSIVIEDIQHFITEIEGHDASNSRYGTEEETYNQGSSEGSTPHINIADIVVGFEDESKEIVKRLIEMSTQRNIVAIVGMPGLGKTTIAKKVYNHSAVANRFHRRAWCCVSQAYQKKEVLLQIYRSVAEVKLNEDQLLKKTDQDIAEMLSKCLNERRYLVVLDDIWESKVWEDLETSLRNDNNGSRVIITTRDYRVAEKMTPATPHDYLLPLRVFNDEESSLLLQKKLFRGDGFPKELYDSGMMIAQQCRGLPLAVVLAAGILSKTKKNKDSWVMFGKSLSTQISDLCRNLIELSYTRLPDHLKCCFLYFGAFPEDKEISARKLAQLWIAEGFVRDANPESLEDIAETYLMDLIGRSLVIGSKSVSRPGIKSCHVHDLLRDFCLAKAKEENFLQVVHGYDKYLPPDMGHFDYGVDSGHARNPNEITHLQYRLSIYSKRRHFILANPSDLNVRTLFFHALADIYPNYRYDVSFVSRYFKLIKVLDLGSINIGDSLSAVASMLHLRYLEVKVDIESIPNSIANLWKLETFILRGSRIAVISVPKSIWSLLRLRHLHIDGNTTFDLEGKGIADSTILVDMESFSTPTISYGDDVEEMLHRLPNLRKMKCIFLDCLDHFRKCNRFPVLEFLTQLESLNVSCNYKPYLSAKRYPCLFNFPTSLTKLTLSEFGLPWSEISAIGRLPNLNALKLLSKAFTGKSWVMGEGDTFQSLKFLKLESLDIEEWTATDEHIPSLQRLMLSKCKKLKEIPSEFAYIDTLEIIELRWCDRSAANSARSIQEKAKEEYGADKITVLVSEENPGASS